MRKRILIEFFDHDSLENVVSLTGGPYDEVVCLCFPRVNEPSREQVQVFESFVRRHFRIPVRFLCIPEQTIERICRTLEDLVEPEKDYEIDLTGGSEVFSAAAGCYLARSGHTNVALQQFDVRRGQRVFRYPRADRPVQPLELSVREAVALHRAAVMRDIPPFGGDQLDSVMEQEILRLWEAVKDLPRQWNHFCTMPGFTPVEYRTRQEKGLRGQSDASIYEQVARRLRDAGILKNEDEVTVDGRDYRVYDLNVAEKARVLYQKGGNLLELYCALGARKAGCFHDCQVGVMLDWDREDGERGDDVRNEVDVVLTRGYIPIFISCKNTQVENEYLYEIMTMARRFGGRYARPAIVSNVRHKRPIRDRAREMGILLLDEVNKLTMDQFSDRLKGELSL